MAESPMLDLTPLHEQAALLLAQGHKVADVASALDLTLSTLYYWRKQPLFEARVIQIREHLESEALAYATQKMKQLHVAAVDRLEFLMHHAESEAVQLKAVQMVFEAPTSPLRPKRESTTPQTGPTGAVILHERMLIAMQQVSTMLGDEAMSQQLTPLLEVSSEDAAEA